MMDRATRDVMRAARQEGKAVRKLVAAAFDRLDDLSETSGDGISVQERVALREVTADLARVLVKLDTGTLRNVTGLPALPREVTG